MSTTDQLFPELATMLAQGTLCKALARLYLALSAVDRAVFDRALFDGALLIVCHGWLAP